MFLHKKFVGQGQENAEVVAAGAATSAGVPRWAAPGWGGRLLGVASSLAGRSSARIVELVLLGRLRSHR